MRTLYPHSLQNTLSLQIWWSRKKSFLSPFRHSRESGNPVNSNSSGLLLPQEWRLLWLFTKPSKLVHLQIRWCPKGLECSKCSVILESRKKNQIACNHKVHVSPMLWRGLSLVPPKFFFACPAELCGRQPWGIWERISRRCLRRNLPFLPGPYRVFIKYSINEFGDEPIIFIFIS